MTAGTETWFITGAGGGIGMALVRAHLARGGKVYAHHRGAPGDALTALQAAHPDRLTLVAFDLREPGISAAINASVDGPVDVLVNNAGVFGPRGRRLAEDDRAAALAAFDVNVLGAIYVTQALDARLKSAKRARIVAISSLLGTAQRADKASLSYALSKAALNMAVHMLAHDMAPHGIATAALRPGHVPTAMNGFTGPDSPEASAAGLLSVIDGLTPQTPPPFLDFTGAELDW